MVTFGKPPKLAKGDAIGIVAPAKYIDDEDTFGQGMDVLKELGFRVVTGENVHSRYRETTAPAPERTSEIMSMFTSQDIKAIVCLTGSGGSSELLSRMDYDEIRRQPKIFSGQSDITHLHLALLSQVGIMTLHGMELMYGFGAERGSRPFEYNVDLFMRCCMCEGPLGEVPHLGSWECWRPGIAEGRLVGGYFGIVASHALGRYWPPLDKMILFWEAIARDAKEIVERFRALETQGFFNNVAGMVVGKLICPSGKTDARALKSGVRKGVLEITETYGFPIIGNADFGHDGSFMPLPEGLMARIDASEINLEYLESFVQ